MKRIAFVHNQFPAGGAERITADVASYLSKVGGYEVHVYASRVSEDLLTDEIRNSLTIHIIPSQAVPSARSKAIERLITEDRIDVLVQVTKSLPDIDGIRSRTGCKAVLACHGEPFWQRHAIVHRRQKGFVRKTMWRLYNRRRFADGTLAMKMAVERSRREYESCDAYTVLCEAYRAETAKIFGIEPSQSHIYAIENPEPPVHDPEFQKEKIILFCGRFENWSKRIDRLLRIWSVAQKRLPQWRLVLVGDGKDGKMLRQMALDLGLERVSFEGMQNDVAPYYRKASIVCLTSATEGWPLALTEGQAHGCICVAFDCTSGISEILDPAEGCGFTVPSGDEAAYVETLVKVAQMDEQQQRDIRRKAVEKRLEYVPEKIAQKWKSLFDMLCHS